MLLCSPELDFSLIKFLKGDQDGINWLQEMLNMIIELCHMTLSLPLAVRSTSLALCLAALRGRPTP